MSWGVTLAERPQPRGFDVNQPGSTRETFTGLAQGATTDLVGSVVDLGAAATGIASQVDPRLLSMSPKAALLSYLNPFAEQAQEVAGSEALGQRVFGDAPTEELQKIRDDARLVGGVVGLGEMITAKGATKVAGGIEDFMQFLPNVRAQAVTPEGSMLPLPDDALPDTSITKMSADTPGAAGDRYTQQIQSLQKQVRDIRKIPDREEALSAVADAQRGIPEIQMRYTTDLMGGGVQSHVIEHTGDLLHRITEKGGAFGAANAAPKIKSVIRTLESKYGHNRDFMESLRKNYSFYVEEAKRTGDPLKIPETYEKFESKVMSELDAYANFHAQLPVFNEVQKAARDAAIAVGRRDFDGALKNLKFLDGVIEDGSFAQRNSSFDPEFETKAAAPKSTGLLGGDKPQRFFHGTGETFKDFDPDAKYTFVSSEPRVANFFAQGTFEGSPNIRPVYLKDANFFDPKNPAHLESLAKSDWYKSNRRKLRKHPFDRTFLKGEGRGSLRDDYNMIEATGLDDALQEMGYDGFATYEMGAKNLAVFNVDNIVSGVQKKAEGGIVSLLDVARNTGRGPRGVSSLAPVARNMNRPMVS